MGDGATTWNDETGPPTVSALLERASAIAGVRVVDIAAALGRPLLSTTAMTTLTNGNEALSKGFIGELVEGALGLPRSNHARPDVAHLGIEVKSLPIDENGRVKESTYVTKVGVDDVIDTPFLRSRAFKKLQHVLFVLVEPTTVPLAQRRFGASFLWQPDDVERTLLEADYEDYRDLCRRGLADMISARRGHVMQVRPKGRNAQETGRGTDEEFGRVTISPRGFYLRPSFTATVVERCSRATSLR